MNEIIIEDNNKAVDCIVYVIAVLYATYLVIRLTSSIFFDRIRGLS